MTDLTIAQQRLINQRLTGIPFEKPADVVNGLVAVQAQDYAGAKWALGQRLQDAHDADLDRAFNAGDILRTHVMRPTWHFVTPADIRWLLALTAPRVHAVSAAMYRRLELDSATFKRCHKVLIKALRDGQTLTREELSTALQEAGIVISSGQRLAYIIMQAELEALICSGPRRGKQFTYALLDERAPAAKHLKPDEALAELAQRYFASHGPATARDFAKWSGLGSTAAKRGLASVTAQLQHQTINGGDYWFAPISSSAPPLSPTAYLLSIYDEYIIGYKDRSMLANPEVIGMLFTMGGALSYLLVLDGQIVGTFRRTLSKDTVTITIESAAPLTKAQMRAVAAAAQRYGEFLQKSVVLA